MPKSVVEIKKVKTGYRVKYYGSNGELLNNSEVLETVANARKNIKAMVKLLNNPFIVNQS